MPSEAERHRSCNNDPSIEQMEKDLTGAGWVRRAGFIYETLWGTFYRGPHKAWHIWHGGEAEWNEIVENQNAK